MLAIGVEAIWVVKLGHAAIGAAYIGFARPWRQPQDGEGASGAIGRRWAATLLALS